MPHAAADIPLPNQLNVMLYGDYGTGKTTFATTFPKPILFFDIDKRYVTYAGMEGVEYETYVDVGKRASAYRTLMKDLMNYQTDSKYATVVLDSTTTLMDIITNDILGISGTGRGATEGLSLPQWGTMVDRFKRIFAIMKGYNCHTVIISHGQLVQDELSGEIMHLPMLVGKKFPQRAPLFFDEIYRCYTQVNRDTKQKEWLCQTQADRKYGARSSLNIRDSKGKVVPVLEEVEPQDFEIIMNKVEDARNNPLEFVRRVQKLRGKTG